MDAPILHHDSFALIVTCLNGAVYELKGLLSTDSLQKLHENVAEITGIPLRGLRISDQARMLSSLDRHETLQAVGIGHYTGLTAIHSVYPCVDSFDKLSLKTNLLRGIYAYGFKLPTEIQRRGITPILDGRDTVGQALSGTGKTAAYIIGVLQRIDYANNYCQALIVTATRELARITSKIVLAIGDYLNVSCHACIGGVSVRQDNMLRDGQQCVIGTPRCILNTILPGPFRINDLVILVLDEVDEMLSRGLKDQIYELFKSIPRHVQVCLFSVTMPTDVFDIITTCMKDVVHVAAEPLALHHTLC